MTLVIIRKNFDFFLSIFARILVFCIDFNILYSRNICFAREELLYIKAGCVFVFVDFVYSTPLGLLVFGRNILLFITE
jgi:hypothetical protein